MDQPAVKPPSTYMTCPVQKSDAGDSKYSAIPIRSSASPSRPSGIRDSDLFFVAWPTGSSLHIQAVNFDLNTVGAMEFTVIPYRPHSVARTLVNASVAPLDVQYPV